jgi:hypothetical protein
MKFDDGRPFACHSLRFLAVNGCGRCLLSQNRSTYRYGVQQMRVYHFVVTLGVFLFSCVLSDQVIFSVLLNFQLIDD